MDIKEKIKSIGCGSDFYLIVTNNDKTYSWGLNKIDDLGMPRQLCFQKELCEVTTLSGKTIVKIACGTDHTLALTDKGKVYGWGSNSDGQSNLTSRDCVPYPTMVNNLLLVKKILDIAAMHNRSFIKSNENGLVYMWGHFANVSIKKPFVCEYTNVFDVFNSMTAQSSMSVVHEFTKEECDILNDLEAAFNDRSTSDLTILVEGQSIYVHKRILKMRCTYFRNMFQTDYIENNQSIINHRHYSYVVYESFLKYLYTGKINLSSIDDLLDLLKLADEVCEKHLEMDCIRTIKKTITVSNIACLINLLNEMAEHHKKVTDSISFLFSIVNVFCFLIWKYMKVPPLILISL
ncbi:RCC1 and BTB domain-containing protein 1 [Trachymyrmex zeteki]|uniref:RCC1 and BTB domain-containing protein 1 n=1 Tax=Mycetomoellerius zeteki TaxID=64791 RepID=A0A151WGY3_9HYME|nr:RCC1 and BTB domain-containing protein 1 [Trachymyrmex zeteki]